MYESMVKPAQNSSFYITSEKHLNSMDSGVRLPSVFILLVTFIQHSVASIACVPTDNSDPHSTLPCIPLDLVNQAFAAARKGTGLEPFTGGNIEHHHDHIDLLGHVLTETTALIAKEVNFNPKQIREVLTKLDTSQTDVGKFCPVQLKHKACDELPYRTVSGHCNNLDHPDWGATLSPFANLVPPRHLDGISIPRHAEDGGDLPPARLVSAVMHRDSIRHDHSITTMLIAWGQIMDHDITLTADTKDPVTLKEPDCCHDEPHHRHHNCFAINIPHDDPFYAHRGRHCMNFLRSFAGVRTGCRLGPRVSFNTISSFIDANFAYGSTPEVSKSLRLGKLGLLKSLDIFQEYGLKPLLPLKTVEPDDGCIRANPDLYCFLAGDNRVNEQLILTVLHTIFLREHNRIAENLYAINPHWGDELLYQETRRIVIATTQHITFNEFLPMVLGRDLMIKYGLELQETGYWDGYDPEVNPSALEEFITSAFRFGHSLLPHRIERWSHHHSFVDSKPLHKLLRQPYDVYRPGYVDTFILGLVNQLAQAMDEGVTEEVTTLLFKEPKHDFGMDLAAMNIQRGRDHGVPGYTTYRRLCGLSPVHYWDDLIGVMSNETVTKYRSFYRSPHDIDLWSGGVSETPSEGSLLGPTFGCIIAEQFRALRYGDRFWYELPKLPSSFTLEQLEEIRKVKLSQLLCQNSDGIKSIQVYAMMLPDGNINPRVPCHSLVHGGINLEAWRDVEEVPQKEHYEPPEIDQEVNEVEEDINNLYRLPPPPEHIISHHSDYRGFHGNTVANASSGQYLQFQEEVPRGAHLEKVLTIKVAKPPIVLTPIKHLPRKRSRNLLPPVKPYPENQPFPGLDGLFSPNPGYLVRHQFPLHIRLPHRG